MAIDPYLAACLLAFIVVFAIIGFAQAIRLARRRRRVFREELERGDPPSDG